jgi:hypothetical protein
MAMEVALGHRGDRPRSVTFLSGDVHHSYVSRVLGGPPGSSAIVQAVCSPIRNPLPYALRFATAVLAYGVAAPAGLAAARSAKVPDPPFRWRRVKGPWFDNNLATLEVTEDGLELWWARGTVKRRQHERPRLERVAVVRIGPGGEVSAARP